MSKRAKVRKQIAELLDDAMLNLLQKGRRKLLDDGSEAFEDPTAADLAQIRLRLVDLGLNRAGEDEDGPAAQVRKTMLLKYKNRQIAGVLPPVDTTSEDAASA